MATRAKLERPNDLVLQMADRLIDAGAKALMAETWPPEQVTAARDYLRAGLEIGWETEMPPALVAAPPKRPARPVGQAVCRRGEEREKGGFAIPNVIATRQTEKALLCEIDGEDSWIPQSQITAESEVWRAGDEGTLVVTHWFARQREWME